MSTLHLRDATARVDLGAFTARVVRLDAGAVLRLRRVDDGLVEAWARTPFDVLATRSVPGVVEPSEASVMARELLAALTVARDDRIDVAGPPPAARWRAELPAQSCWEPVAEVPAAELDRLAEGGLAIAGEHTGGHGPPAELLDQTAFTANPGDDDGQRGRPVRVPMRCLFALAGVGLLGDAGQSGTPGESAQRDAVGSGAVGVRVTDSWLRLDARFGCVVCRRRTMLPLAGAR